MREILFRGKDYEGSWVEGDLINKADDGTFIGFDIEENFHSETTYWYKEVLVDPETIGQFTGLLDKNGNKIFEGDIYIYKDYSNGAVISLTSKNSSQPTRTAVVEIDNMIVGIKTPYGAAKFESGLELEVIGNIHDNPELLEDKC